MEEPTNITRELLDERVGDRIGLNTEGEEGAKGRDRRETGLRESPRS